MTSHLGTFSISVPGKHNISNAIAAISAAAMPFRSPGNYRAEADASKLASTLETFAGTLRRFERKGEARGVLVYDDYGHHPTEVRATLGAAKEFLARPICVVFQPHRYSRTQALWRDFGTAFESADTIIITQLYSAHETPIEGVSGRLVFDAVRENNSGKPVFYAENLDEAVGVGVRKLEAGRCVADDGRGRCDDVGAARFGGTDFLTNSIWPQRNTKNHEELKHP